MRRSGLAFALAFAGSAQAQSVDLDRAHISAHGDTITVTHLPVHTATGTVLQDVTIRLRADGTGSISFVSGPKPVARPTPPPVIQHFLAGTYKDSGGNLYTLHNRGANLLVGDDSPRWEFTSVAGGSIASALWSAGPGETGPVARRLRNADITSGQFSYGVVEDGPGERFGSGALIGATQTGNTLVLVSFRKGCCTDVATPMGQIQFEYVSR